MKFFIFFVILILIPFAENAKFKSCKEFLKKQIPAMKISSTVLITSTTSTSINNTLGDTLFEKILIVATSSFCTALWFIPKIHQYHQQDSNDISLELIVSNPTMTS